ncbi:hypothetical protein [Stutzerimonas tarimensis]|uniref:Glycosyltransferase RgtA/B/C/D-like domain-containing protein n=1 Tax=Stutzerimonas tarimensis TaxID=1507735 RepID=A0ABV7T9H8_9GAMM
MANTFTGRMRGISVFGWLVVLSILITAGFFAQREALDVPLSQVDGAYQTASGLYRLAAGERPGADFYPYLGVGLLYFLYPVFRLAGGDLAASVFASFFMVWLGTLFSIGLVAALLARAHRLWVGVLVAGGFGCVAMLLSADLHPLIAERLFPGNSLRPIRSLVPFIGAVLLFVLLRSRLNLPSKAIGAGMVSGLMFPWSNDYGVPAAAMLGLFAMAWVAWQERAIGWRPFVVPLVGLVTAVLLLALGTGGSPLAMLKYNLGVSHDQNWYFACWNEPCRIHGLGDLYGRFLGPAIGGWFWVLPGLALVAAVSRSFSLWLLTTIGATLLLGGLISAGAGHVDFGYAAAYLFWSRLVVYLAPLALVLWLLEHFRLRWWLVAAPLVALVAMATSLKPVWQHQQALQARQTQPERFVWSEPLGAYLPPEWAVYVEQGTALRGQRIVEDYWGLWSAATASFGGTPTDALIHALGPARGEFAEVMASRPEVVVTGAPAYLNFWSGWLLSSSWWFYEPLLRGYERGSSSPGTQVWVPSRVREWQTIGCRVSNGEAPEVIIETDRLGHYEVRLDYRARFSRGTLLLARNNLNYAKDAEGYVSIDPRAEQWTYPVALVRPGENRFGFRLTTRNDSLAGLRLQGCRARRIEADAPQLLPLINPHPNQAPYDLTDPHWSNGMHRWLPALLMENTAGNRALLVQGKRVHFYDGSVRQVVDQRENDSFLEIYLDGHPLHGGLGFPHEFEVEEP